MAPISSSGVEISIEKAGFRFSFKPRLALVREPSDPTSIELLPGVARVRYPEGVGVLHFIEPSAETTVIVAEAEGASESGLVAELRARLEGFDRLLLYHFTYDPDRYFQDAPEPYQYPQLREAGEFEYCPWSYPLHASSFDGLPRNLKVSQLLCRGSEGYLFILPVSNSGARGYISKFDGKEFSVLLHGAAPTRWKKALLLTLSASPSPYRAVEAAYEATLTLLGKPETLRRNKSLPDVFRYLGWCSWNACWREPTAEKVLAAYKSLLEKGVKAGFVLIDDGWQDEETAPWPGQRIRRLLPDERKFPGGFAPLISELKKLGAKYVGLWHTLNVHWGGVAKGSELAERWREHLVEIDNYLVPNPLKAFELFKDWYTELRRWGFDFVKVDNQSFVGYAYSGRTPIERAARELHEGLEAAAYVNSLEVLNCMAQQPENAFNWLRSTVARNCVDYIVPHRKSRDKLHLYFNAYNALFMSQVVWPDWDMFQSHDPWALQQAVARAVSGGPVYVTDEPGKTVAEIVKPLAFSDGSLPLPDFPALPTEDSLMRDPYNEAVPLKIFTHVTVDGVGTYGIVAAFNIHRDDAVVRGHVAPPDALLPPGKYWVYEYFSGELGDGELQFELEPMGVKLFIIAPRRGWLDPVGLNNVYIMPRGIDHACIFEDEAVLKLKEPGLLIARTERKVKVEGGEIAEEQPLLKVKCTSTIIRLRA
ncbi:MAG: Sip1-related alpha-galactosidase [Thermofilaceae archaeon]